MARIRTIKPEFWADEKLAPLDAATRLVFLGIISHADDLGRIVDNIKQIDALIFPETSESSREALANLSRIGRIIRGTTASGQRIIQIANWARHQRVDHPNLAAALPEIVEPQGLTEIREALATDSRGARDGFATLSVPVPTTSTSTSTTDLRPAVSGETGDVLKFPKSKKSKVEYSEEFEAVWTIYPHPPGDSKQDAAKCFEARRKGGHSLEVIQAGIAAYRRYCEAQGWLKTKFCKQGATFFGPGLHFLSDWSYSPIVAAKSFHQMSAAERKAHSDEQMALAAVLMQQREAEIAAHRHAS